MWHLDRDRQLSTSYCLEKFSMPVGRRQNKTELLRKYTMCSVDKHLSRESLERVNEG